MQMRKNPMSGGEWSPEQIRAQLSRIQSSDEVSNAEVLQQFLQFIVEETLAGRVREIKEYTIGIRALGRPPGFNPQVDASVRIHAGRLRRVLGRYYNGAGKYDPIRIEMPKGAYIPVFISNDNTNGNAYLQDAAHIVEGEALSERRVINGDMVTDRGMRVQEERMREGNGETMNGAPTGAGMMAGVAEEPRIVRHKLTIAVLPFLNLSDDAGKDHFAIGLGEQMSTELSRFQDIAIVSYYSTRHCTMDTADIAKVSDTLGAHYILTGSVRAGQGSVRVSVQLIFAQTGEQIWAANYDRGLTPATQQEISDEIIGQVAPWVAGYYGIINHEMANAPEWQRTQVLGRYDAVSWFFYHHKQYNLQSLTKAKAALEQALAIDPGYAVAWAILGELYIDSYLLEIAGAEAIKKAVEYGRNAMRLDPHCLHAYQTLSQACLLQHDREGCIQIMEECLALNPHATDNLGWKGIACILLGEYTKGKELIDRAIRLNPFYPWCYNFAMSLYYYWEKEYTQALSWAQKINMPSLKFDVLIRAAIQGQMGTKGKAREAAGELLLLWPGAVEEVEDFLQRFILHRGMIAHILKGLQKAGLQ